MQGALAGTLAVMAGSVTSACSTPERGAATVTDLALAPSGKASGAVSQLLVGGADPSTPGGKAMLARIEKWQAMNPDATVSSASVPSDQIITAAVTRSRAGELADVVQLYPGTLHDAVFPVLASLSPSMFPDIKDSLTLWDYTTKEPSGDLAGVPIGNQGGAWYYNKELWSKAGLDPDKTPQTWDELTSAVDALKGSGVHPLGMSRGYAGFYLWASILVQFMPEPERLAQFRAGTVPITSDEFKVSLSAVSKMARDGWFHPSFMDKEDDSATADFSQGNVGMYCAQLGSWSTFDLSLDPDAYGVFLPPKHPEAAKFAAYVTPDTMFCLNKDSKNAEAALSWINYLGTKEGLTEALQVGGVMPNRPDVDVASVTTSKAAPVIAEWLAAVPGNEVPLDFFNGDASGTLYSKLPTVLTSGDIDPFLEQLQAEQSA
jgi:ABC-type glycerol-3-phosphate transport system substrate-binding protein